MTFLCRSGAICQPILVAAALLLGPLRQSLPAQGPPLSEGFERIDENGDGKLSAEELGRFPQLRLRLLGADQDGDGLVSRAEFGAGWASGPRPASAPAGPLTAGEHLRVIPVGDLLRRYRIHVPKRYDPAKPTPVVVVFHGGGGNPESMVRLSGMNTKSDEVGFLVVYPYGSGVDPDRGLSFHGGGCCGYAMLHEIDDVGFTRAMLDDLGQIANVDSDRVFATGLSNGAIMAHRVAAELADRIAAIAPVGGPLMLDSCRPSRPVPVLHFHGTADEFAPFAGGFGKGVGGRKGVTEFRSVDATIQAWVEANGCRDTPEVVVLPDAAEDGMTCTRKTWGGGRDGSEVVLIEIAGGGHTWPGRKPLVAALGPATMDISANDVMWQFFVEHPRRRT